MGLKKFFAKLLNFESSKERHYSALPGEDEETKSKVEQAEKKSKEELSEKYIKETEEALSEAAEKEVIDFPPVKEPLNEEEMAEALKPLDESKERAEKEAAERKESRVPGDRDF